MDEFNHDREDPFLDTTTISAEQKFMFMLLDRIEKLESENTELKKQVKKLNDLCFKEYTVPEYARDFYNHIKNTREVIEEKEKTKKLLELEAMFTDEKDIAIVKKLPHKKLNEFNSILTYKLTHSFSIFHLMKVLEKYENEEPLNEEVVEWLKRKVME